MIQRPHPASWLLLILTLSTYGGAQTATTQVTNVAPAPSTRFPADWYPADNPVTATDSPSTDAPYTATLRTTSYFANETTGEVKTLTQNTFQARDSAGRRRDETEMPRPDGHGGTVLAHEVSVSDPVSHCSFRWLEPWIAPGHPVATVSCMSRTLHYVQGGDAFAGAIFTQAEERQPFPGTTDRSEPLGQRMFGDLQASGLRHTRTTTQDGKTQRLTTELWYSPALKEMLVFKGVPEPGETSPIPDFELTAIHRGEPDPALFYPPAGYEIRPGH